jgi:hypothetical protein
MEKKRIEHIKLSPAFHKIQRNHLLQNSKSIELYDRPRGACELILSYTGCVSRDEIGALHPIMLNMKCVDEYPYIYKVKYLLTFMEKKKCQICGRLTAVSRECILCGKHVCPRCFRISMGVCKACMPGRQPYYDVLKEYVD